MYDFLNMNSNEDELGFFINEYRKIGAFEISRCNNSDPVVAIIPTSPIYSFREEVDPMESFIATRRLERKNIGMSYSRALSMNARNPFNIQKDVSNRLAIGLDDLCCTEEPAEAIEVTQDRAFRHLIEENMEGATCIVLGSKFKYVVVQELLNYSQHMSPINMSNKNLIIYGTKCIISNGIPEDEAFLLTNPKILVNNMQVREDHIRECFLYSLDYYFSNRRIVKLKMKPYDGLRDLSYRVREMNDLELTNAVKDIFGDSVDFRIDNHIRESDEIINSLMNFVKGD